MHCIELLKEEKPSLEETKKLDNFLTLFFLPGLYLIPILLKQHFVIPAVFQDFLFLR